MSAGSVAAARSAHQQARGGASPTPALQLPSTFAPRDLKILPIAPVVARHLCELHHYLRTYPGGALLNFGAFAGQHLLGVCVLTVGPFNAHRFFRNARPKEVLCLARFWLDDRCGRNSESRVLSVICRSLRRWQSGIKALVAYSDPAAGHDGSIYRAAGFAYLGTSEATPLYRLPDGSVHHSRSLGHSFGTRSVAHFHARGVAVRTVPQAPKFVYVALIDPAWRERLTRLVLPYRDRALEAEHEGS